MKMVFSPKCLEYGFPGHPESPDRVKYSYEFLKSRGFGFCEPEPCERKDILLAHSEELVEKVVSGRFYEPDTPNLPGIFDYASLSAGSAIKAAEICLKGEKAFSLMRPPGHHAGRDFLMGFCYFNNIAIAVGKILRKTGRVAVIDFDCHHGNGTQDIFLGREGVIYISLHQSPLYPGTGIKSERNCINFPLPAGTREQQYILALKKALEEAKRFGPDAIAVSAGFDSHKDDPIGGMNLETKTFYKIGKMIKEVSEKSFAVLEGGYGTKLPECIFEFIRGWCY